MLSLFRRRDPAPPIAPAQITEPIQHVCQMDQPLLMLPGNVPFALDQAVQGVQIFGGTGSGKTSGSGQWLAQAYIRAGFGGLVLCAKPDEAENWRHYAKACGRERDVLVFNEQSGFNFLNYEMATSATTQNVVQTLMNVIKAGRDDGGIAAREPFWDDTVKELLSNAIDVIHAAYGTLRLADLFKFIDTAALSEKEGRSNEWQERSFHFQTFVKAATKPAQPIPKHDLDAIMDYFGYNWARMSDRTRSSVVATFSSMVSRFRRGALHDMFAADTTMVPEMAHEGAILLIDLPLKRWHDDGGIAAHIWKFAFQRATERRAVDETTRPVFLWVDESQLFLNEYDAEFQSTARSARAATVYLTQNINYYEGKIGGQNSRALSRALLSNLRTKIFHQNDDIETNEYAAELIGKVMHWRRSISEGTNEGRNWSETSGQSQSLQTSENESDGFNRNEGGNMGWSTSAGVGGAPMSSGFSGGSSHGRGRSFSRSTGHSSGVSTQTSQSGGESRGSNRSKTVQEQKDYIIDPHYFRTSLRNGRKQNDYQVDAVVIGPDLPDVMVCSFRQSCE